MKIRTIKKTPSILIDKALWLLDDAKWKIVQRKASNKKIDESFTIGIATFMDRFENCLKPLLERIALLFPDHEIIVVANGHVKKKEQETYLTNIGRFCGKFDNVTLVAYREPKGLSFIWNRIVEASTNKIIFLFNDDIKIKIGFRTFINESGILMSHMALINKSWSHFLITKPVFEKVGMFDEGFLEIGGEDDDYAARLAIKKIKIMQFSTNTIAGRLKANNKKLKTNSYGRDMNLEEKGYSSYNSKYLQKKWIIQNLPFDQSVYVPDRLYKYWKLRD